MKHILLFLVTISFSNSFTQNKSDLFFKNIEKCKLNFRQQPNYSEFNFSDTNLIKVDYCLKNLGADFYVAYSILPIDKNTPKNENKFISRDENGEPIDQHIADFQKLVFDIFSQEYFDYSLFDSVSVKKEFGADWGASSSFNLKNASFNGLKYCTLVVIHKENVATIYAYYIADTRDQFNEIMSPLFYNLTFE